MSLDARGSNINVVVRLRPLNEKEQVDGTLPVVTSSTQNKEVTIIRGSGKAQVRSTFKYDGVFGSYATQTEVFEAVNTRTKTKTIQQRLIYINRCAAKTIHLSADRLYHAYSLPTITAMTSNLSDINAYQAVVMAVG